MDNLGIDVVRVREPSVAALTPLLCRHSVWVCGAASNMLRLNEHTGTETLILSLCGLSGFCLVF